jgi:hypothetical protein
MARKKVTVSKKTVERKVVKVEEAVCKVLSIPLKGKRRNNLEVEIGCWDEMSEKMALDGVLFRMPCGDSFVCSREDAKLIGETLIKHLN